MAYIQFDDGVDGLKIADGLKELLSTHRLTADSILYYDVEELASLLGIDEYVAKLIINAATSDSR